MYANWFLHWYLNFDLLPQENEMNIFKQLYVAMHLYLKFSEVNVLCILQTWILEKWFVIDFLQNYFWKLIGFLIWFFGKRFLYYLSHINLRNGFWKKNPKLYRNQVGIIWNFPKTLACLKFECSKSKVNKSSQIILLLEKERCKVVYKSYKCYLWYTLKTYINLPFC